MFQKISTILLWSENYKALADWYQDMFGLKVNEALNHPEDTGILFEFPQGGPWLWVGQHSKVHGKNTNPDRIMFNITVDSVEKAFEYLTAKNITVVAKPFKAPTMDKYFATFLDLDGNTVQIIGSK